MLDRTKILTFVFILGQIKHVLEVAHLHVEIRFGVLPDQTALLTHQAHWKIVYIHMRVNPRIEVARWVITNQPVRIESPDESFDL